MECGSTTFGLGAEIQSPTGLFIALYTVITVEAHFRRVLKQAAFFDELHIAVFYYYYYNV